MKLTQHSKEEYREFLIRWPHQSCERPWKLTQRARSVGGVLEGTRKMARQEIKAESLFFPAVSKDKMSTIDIFHLVPCRLVRFVQI
jgi:hypothetical protein